MSSNQAQEYGLIVIECNVTSLMKSCHSGNARKAFGINGYEATYTFTVNLPARHKDVIMGSAALWQHGYRTHNPRLRRVFVVDLSSPFD